MFDFLDKTGIKFLLEFVKSKLSGKSDSGHTHSKADITDFPASLPANGGNADYATNAGNADTVDNVHISCTNDAISNNNWFAAFTNENNLRAIDPQRAYVGNAGLLKPTLIGIHESCTYHTILDWANSVDGMGQAHTLAAGGFPSDTPVGDEGLITVETDFENKRKVVTFKSYGSGRGTYRRNIWSGEWRWGWVDLFSEKPYVTGVASARYGEKANVSFGFTPSMVLYQPVSPKSNIPGSIYVATMGVDANGFTPNQATYNQQDSCAFVYIAFK